MIIRPSTFAKMVTIAPVMVHDYKKNEEIPMEASPLLSDTQSVLLTHPQIPAQSHARDHFFSYNEEQVVLVLDVLSHYKGTVGADFTEKIRHDVVENRIVSFGDPTRPTVVHQLKIALHKGVPSRRVWLSAGYEEKVHLVRRHGHTPGLDFSAPLDESLVTTVDTMIITLRAMDSAPYTLGTAFAGSSFPGSEENDGTGILYKWYADNADGQKKLCADAELFSTTIKAGKIPALWEPTAFSAMISAT